MNVTDVIWRHSFAFPDREALVCDDKRATYAQLRNTIHLVSARLYEAGVRRGDNVAISIQHPMAFLIMAFAVGRLGAAASTLSPSQDDIIKEALLDRHQVRFVIQAGKNPWRSGLRPDLVYLSMAELMAPLSGEAPAEYETAQDADELTWYIALSSGTTAVPKSIATSHQRGILLGSLLRYEEVNARRFLLLAGHGSTWVINFALRALYAGATAILSTRYHDPVNFFHVAAAEKPDLAVLSSGLAATVVSHAAKSDLRREAVCGSIQSVHVGGGPVSPAVIDGIRKYVCDNLWIVYGASEIGGLTALAPRDADRGKGCVGRLHSWVEAQAVDENDQVLPAGKVGILRFKAPTMAHGYLADEGATARAFRQGWFYPGDIGAVGAAGYLFLGGRMDQVLNIGGNKLDPHRIETVINKHPAILESAAVSVADPNGMQILVAVAVPRDSFDANEVRQFCGKHLKPYEVPRAVVSVASLPKNDNGKIMRRQVASMIKVLPPGGADQGGGNETVH